MRQLLFKHDSKRKNTIIMKTTLETIFESNVHDEIFLTALQSMLEKFVNEFEDMSQMKAIKQAKELLNTINQ